LKQATAEESNMIKRGYRGGNRTKSATGFVVVLAGMLLLISGLFILVVSLIRQ
jgi:hypothetical protein